MMNNKSTKKAFLMSMLSLLLCVSMFVGTTFAWFTDEVTSTNNVIQSGRLDAGLYYGDAAEDITEDASTGAIFDYDLWEPGYTQIRYVKITNEGNLAFKFQLNIIPNMQPAAGEANLADVIDVYMFDVDADVSREAIAAAEPVGTLSELMADADGAAYGYLLPAEGVGTNDYNEDVTAPCGEISYCIVLKMQESAGNEYQNLSVGNGFSVQLLATQYTWENDSFDHTYDDGAEYDEAPKANVSAATPERVQATWGMGGSDVELDLNAKFIFETTETYEEAQQSPYAKWHADFVVSADGDIGAMQAALAGYYAAYCDDYNNEKWVALASEEPITAGTELRLLYLMLNGGSMSYEELCNWVPVFECGVADLSEGDLAGTTLTVELRLYEVPAKGECDNGGGCNHSSTVCETGEYIVIGTYTYTFEG